MSAHTVRVGDVFEGITGNRLEVVEVEEDDCFLQYMPDRYDEGVWAENCVRLEQSMDRVKRGPE